MTTSDPRPDRSSRAPDRRTRLELALLRDGPTCAWCGRPFTQNRRPTTEHLVPRAKGGPSWTENELAACARCNRLRGHTSIAEWYEECVRLGWDPDLPRLLSSLERLTDAIGERGGQRRARPYLARELRRLRRLG
ncbi:HNH endonuclease [Nocardioidaceae bacterium]|nr:HNH endonuclease [Nocardioidaceae bacterium]